ALILLFTFPILSIASYPATIHVPGDYPTIQEAIIAAVNGDVVLVDPGTYVENISFKGKSIVVKSTSGPEVTIIDGNQSGTVVQFDSGEGLDAVLEGFTITNGTGKSIYGYPHGGGVFCFNSGPTVRGNRISGNTAEVGGGIYHENIEYGGSITKNVIENNTAVSTSYYRGDGGGICIWYYGIDVTHNIIRNNTAKYSGGGIYCRYNAEGTIAHNLILNNSTLGGGGIFFFNCMCSVVNNLIQGNEAKGYKAGGGGIDCHAGDGEPVFEGNIFAENSADYGGGFHYYCWGSFYLRNNLFYGNSADEKGGAIAGGAATSYFELVNNTLVHNEAGSYGGAIWFEECEEALICNSILWNNKAMLGNDEILINYTDVTVSYSNITGGWAGTGNIELDPLFVDEANNDFHLTYASPCRDAGDNSMVASPFDLEGDPRIAWSGIVDMGADEFYNHLYVTGDTTSGGSIEGKLVGMPGTAPAGLLFGSGVLDPPQPTAWGNFFLQPPWLMLPLVPIPAEGVLILPATIPMSPPAPYDLPMQALIGLDPDSLTNLYVLEVR
ncbi:MAG: right-handed parallel beta-helix repeat-containing protein, partial [Planctomycetota bacterium]